MAEGLFEITSETSAWVAGTEINDGLLTLSLRHTSASLLVQDNADPDVRADLERFFSRLVPMATPYSGTGTRGPTTCRRMCAPR